MFCVKFIESSVPGELETGFALLNLFFKILLSTSRVAKFLDVVVTRVYILYNHRQ